MHPSLLDDERIRRRALAGRLNAMAENLEAELRAARRGSRDLGVAYPRHITPDSLRRWRDDLQDANREEGIGG
jgi:polysaccharide deacetylase 2 family uncharacterized protein YibQ